MNLAELDIARIEITKLELKPGDVLVVKVDANLSQEQAQALQQYFYQHLGEGNKVMILSRELGVSVLTGRHDDTAHPQCQ